MILMKKRKTAFVLLILITVLYIYGSGNCLVREVRAVTFDEVNKPEVFLKQINGDKQCTLVAATMLIRRAAMLSGNTGWADITVDKVKKQAWIDGVGIKYTFTYDGITVNKAAFGPDPVNEAISLLSLHPEGIAIYDQTHLPRAHAVLLTDYTNGEFYSADPSDAVLPGRIPNSSALVQVKDAKYYWYVSSPSVLEAAPSATEVIELSSALNISLYTASLSEISFPYDGTEKKPVVTIPGLTENIDFTVAYYNNIYVGTATAIITGVGAYSGTLMKSFEITEIIINDTLNEIQIDMTNQTIKKGKTATVKVILPDSLEVVKEYSGDPLKLYKEVKMSYTTDNKKIATINSSGKVTGKSKGKTKINVIFEAADGTRKIFTYNIVVE